MNKSTSRQANLGQVCAIRQIGKGYLRRSAKPVRFPLGIRENTRVTVTVREVLFTLTEFFGARFVCTAVGKSPVFYFCIFCCATKNGKLHPKKGV